MADQRDVVYCSEKKCDKRNSPVSIFRQQIGTPSKKLFEILSILPRETLSLSLCCCVCVSALDECGRRYYRPRDARACLIVFDSFVCGGFLSLLSFHPPSFLNSSRSIFSVRIRLIEHRRHGHHWMMIARPIFMGEPVTMKRLVGWLFLFFCY